MSEVYEYWKMLIQRADELLDQKQYRAAAAVADEARYVAREWLHPGSEEAWDLLRMPRRRASG